MDSLDLIGEFLKENGVRCRKHAENILRLPSGSRLVSRDSIIFAIKPRSPTIANKTFDLHHPNSLQDILEWFHGQLRPN